jgi:serine-type D-Ala-D-Ala carboxypeptidase/endopeptidase (penicillin-binding protein 4)
MTFAYNVLKKNGGRWLLIRKPEIYAATSFVIWLRSNGIKIGNTEPIQIIFAVREIRHHESQPLSAILKHVLKYSTSLTADVIGISVAKK